MSRVTILGCGPAGLASAAAAIRSGHRVTVMSASREPSRLYGCQYLHEPIPGFQGVSTTKVRYVLNGTPEEYRHKVYGDRWTGKVSPEDFIGEHQAWDIRRTYELMWLALIDGCAVHFYQLPESISNGTIPREVYASNPDIIISTIPAKALCYRKFHRFKGHVIFANGSTTRTMADSDMIICDGTPEHDWYRISNVFGYRTTEWSMNAPPDTKRVVKPLETDCDCYPEIKRIGRYGRWQKSYLVHQAYPDVMELLK